MKWLDSLNSEQRQAVKFTDGPLLIVAGPGTGKTKTLTARIAYLLSSGKAQASEVLALTFTTKAAREMQERVGDLLGKRPMPQISTFHALSASLLPPDGLSLVTETERQAIIKSLKQSGGDSIRDIGLAISRAKNQITKPQDPNLQKLVAAYDAELTARKLYDYDDLLLKLHAYLEISHNPRPCYKYILVDEFQDTNDLQYELLKLLNTTDNLFVIGDPLQSIYGFRGANAQVFERLQRDWPTIHTVRLTINYRSAPQIIRVAGAIFPEEPNLRPHRQVPGVARVVEALNEYGEADWIINEIERQLGGSDMLLGGKHYAADKQRTFSDFAVLYRTHAVARTLQRSLEKSGIPYQVAGEGSPYLQPPILAITQSLSYLANKNDTPAVSSLSASQAKVLLNAITLGSLVETAEKIIRIFGLATEKNASTIRQFINSLHRFASMPLPDYVAHLQALAEQEYYDPSAQAVALLTIHAAKGLEFSQVFLLGAEQGVLPLSRKDLIADIKEERRLFYVAVTRARDDLYMLHTQARASQHQQPSEFIAGLPQEILEFTADPAMAEQLTRIKKHQQRRSQTRLF